MKWIKKGLIISPSGEYDWAISHAQLPFADKINDDLYRIYYATRNNANMSQIGFIEIDINNPKKILYMSDKPILKLGPLGTFEDSGVFPAWLVTQRNLKYLYYIGWMQGRRVNWYSCLGLAISKDGGKTYKKTSKGPLLYRNNIDPYLTASCCVLVENGLWRMWYTSGIGWKVLDYSDNGSPNVTPYYNIKYAESTDGKEWIRKGLVCIDFKSEDESAIARPCVIKDGELYKMWYCYRGTTYRIGYAESKDGLMWERKDSNAGIDVSPTGWDSEMIAYPFVFEHKGRKFLLYNGNGFGKTGFGYALGVEK